MKSFKDVITRTRITDEAMDSIVKSMIDAQWKAELMEERRMKEFDFKRAAAEIGAESEADQLRMKAHELRTTEEKHYIAMDLVLNPEAYSHLTLSEIEQMRLDKDYHSDLSLTDLERIMKLPALVTLALPFLFSQDEVEAHRLINKYWRSQDDAYFSEKDAKSVRPRSIGSKTNAPKTPTVNTIAAMTPSMVSAGGGGPGPSSLILSALNDSEKDGVSTKQVDATMTQKNNAIWSMKSPMMDTALPIGPAERKLRDQEARHEILLREARRDRVRCLSFFPHEIEGHPTHEDLAWFGLERLLHPYLFPKVKGVFSGKNQLQTSVKGEESIKERYTFGLSYNYENYKCPYDAEELAEIITEIEEEYVIVSGMQASRAISTVAQGEDLELAKVKRLLKMYFVGLDESDNGHDRLHWLVEVSTGICDQMQKAIDADREEDRQRERDRIKAERQDKQRNLTDVERAKLMKKKKATAKKGNSRSVSFMTHPDYVIVSLSYHLISSPSLSLTPSLSYPPIPTQIGYGVHGTRYILLARASPLNGYCSLLPRSVRYETIRVPSLYARQRWITCSFTHLAHDRVFILTPPSLHSLPLRTHTTECSSRGVTWQAIVARRDVNQYKRS